MTENRINFAINSFLDLTSLFLLSLLNLGISSNVSVLYMLSHTFLNGSLLNSHFSSSTNVSDMSLFTPLTVLISSSNCDKLSQKISSSDSDPQSIFSSSLQLSASQNFSISDSYQYLTN